MRLRTLEAKADFQYQLIVRLVDLVHEQYREKELQNKQRDASDKELHLYVQNLADRVGKTLRVHKADIDKLVQLTVGKPTQELIDMKATGIWTPQQLGIKPK